MDSQGRACTIQAEARSMQAGNLDAVPFASNEDPLHELSVPIIVHSQDDQRTPQRRGCLAWPPCRALAAVWKCIHIAFKLVFIVLALMLYSLLLMPGFLRMIVYYFFSKSVVRGVMYGSKSRQRLDLYFPANALPDAVYPVVIYITGGAWTIGYRAWGALLARRLSEQGVVVACLDYRNFPQGDALDMLEDVNTGISWVLSRIHRFGGDPDSVTLVGQSAGGHLAGLALIKQAEQAAGGSAVLGSTPAWSPAGLRAFVGVSGAFDLEGLASHRDGHFRGLLDRILSLEEPVEEGGASDGKQQQAGDVEQAAAVGGGGAACGRGVKPPAIRRKRPAYSALSPLAAARRMPAEAAALLPYALLIHGTADKTVPAEGSSRLCEALTAAGAPRCRCVLVPGKTHTAFLLEDPMRGGKDMLSDTVLGAVLGREEGGAESHVYGTLCPGFLCNMAGWVCPF